MTPSQLAKPGTESAHQQALFCYASVAALYGFKVADDWSLSGLDLRDFKLKAERGLYNVEPIPELAWLHHIPNGGSRGDSELSRAIAGGKLKAEGVKSGVWDIFWPVHMGVGRRGLYIEMKRPDQRQANNGGLSDNQVEFGTFVKSQGYATYVCYTWQEAVLALKWYYYGS